MRQNMGGPETAGRKESPIRVDLLRAGDPAWDDWLSDVPRDVYHTAGYHAYAHGSGEGEPYLIVVGDRQRGFAWPYLLRQVSEVESLAGSGATDVTSVYGYSGPLAWGCTLGDPFLATAWSEVLAVWRHQGAVSAFTRFHPLLGNASLLSALPWPRDGAVEPEPVVALGRTVSIDLSVSEEAARAGYSESLRRQIRNFRQAGLTTTHDEDWTDLAAFAHLYRETMARNAAADYYFFDASDFDRLHTALSGHVHLLVTRMDEVVGAAGLFTEYEGIVQEHLVATNKALAPVSPYKVLIDDAYTWARKRGNTVFHLGGGRGAYEDSLFEFKRRFSPRRHPFFTGRWIIDRQACRDLVKARVSAAQGEGLLDPDYFPAYRAPVVRRWNGPASGPTITKSMPVEAGGEFRMASPGEAEALAELFEDIDETFFRPHPFTADEARRIANLQGRDVYALLFNDGRPVAYGMLRGWNEGFEIPSLGIAVRTDSHRRGFGRLMMAHLHEVARAHGAEKVRLRVHPENHRARRLYESLGYEYAGEDRGELVMLIDVGPAGDGPIGDRRSISRESPGDRQSR
jgi:ribosomal protein S18 acetylase RimI-like enzyme